MQANLWNACKQSTLIAALLGPAELHRKRKPLPYSLRSFATNLLAWPSLSFRFFAFSSRTWPHSRSNAFGGPMRR